MVEGDRGGEERWRCSRAVQSEEEASIAVSSLVVTRNCHAVVTEERTLLPGTDIS